MTYAEFIASRRFVDELGAVTHAHDSGTSGYLYADGLYIELDDENEGYRLELDRSDYASSDLASLEPILYAWAIDSGELSLAAARGEG